uniref:peptidoglycan lytic exotransglycosylase n=1 Tax=mine drainage metagenome TaxID=410659 RepID=E6PUX1_9ZZZZ
MRGFAADSCRADMPCAFTRLGRALARFAWPALAALLLASCASPPAVAPVSPAPQVPVIPAPPATLSPSAAAPLTGTGLRLQAASFADLPGWQADDFADVWTAWQRDCRAPVPQLAAACAASAQVPASDTAAQRRFFEQWFQPWQASGAAGQDSGLVTGYYEPVLKGSLTPGWPYVVPIYGLPADLVPRPDAADGVTRGRVVWAGGRKEVLPYWSRAQISADPQAQAVLGRKVVAWLESPVDALFLQVQGSGLVELPDGRMLRLSYGGDNGWPYKSVGRWLLDQGELRGTVTMQIIRAWAQMHPTRVPQMLDANPRVVFFNATLLGPQASANPMPTSLALRDPAASAADPTARGPTGALGVPLTALRSVAVDKRLLTLGTPLWLATTVTGQPFAHLVFAQDVGSAITGPLRADLFFGTGDAAGDAAGRQQSPGRMWVLLPRGVRP